MNHYTYVTDNPCPACNAPMGMPCLNKRGTWMDRLHPARVALAPDADGKLSYWARQVVAITQISENTMKRVFADDNVPWGVYDACVEGAQRLREVQALLRGRQEMNDEPV
jgi:hypothetical protein